MVAIFLFLFMLFLNVLNNVKRWRRRRGRYSSPTILSKYIFLRAISVCEMNFWAIFAWIIWTISIATALKALYCLLNFFSCIISLIYIYSCGCSNSVWNVGKLIGEIIGLLSFWFLMLRGLMMPCIFLLLFLHGNALDYYGIIRILWVAIILCSGRLAATAIE